MKKTYERPIVIKHYSGLMNKFGTPSVSKPFTEIDGVSISSLAEKFGSPLFVLSEKKIRTNQKNATRVFKNRYPKVQFAWSYKTNYLDAVCSVFHNEGSWAEVVSGYEYEKAKKLGIKGEQIIFNGPDKSDEDILKAIKDKAKIHIDNFDELYKIIEITDKNKLKANVAIRINMDTGILPKWERFGFSYESGEAWQAIKRIISDEKLNLIGLHTHIGTYIMSADAYRAAAYILTSLYREIKLQFDIQLQYIDIGGGFASNNTLLGQYLPAEQMIPTIEQYADAITTGIFQVNLKNEELPLLILETGRALIDDAGFLVSTVLANKRLGSGKKAVIIDAGVNILFTSFWYKHNISPAQDSGSFYEDTVLYGPLCMNIDCIRESVSLPQLKVGDQLVIHFAGAYNMSQWMQFITYRPNIVMILEDNTIEIVRKAEDLNYVTQLESIPSKLKK